MSPEKFRHFRETGARTDLCFPVNGGADLYSLLFVTRGSNFGVCVTGLFQSYSYRHVVIMSIISVVCLNVVLLVCF